MGMEDLNSISQTDTVILSTIQKKAIDIVLSTLEEEEYNNLSPESDFLDIGVDSITFIKVIVALESEFDIEFDVEKLMITAFSTIKSMVEYVEEIYNNNLA